MKKETTILLIMLLFFWLTSSCRSKETYPMELVEADSAYMQGNHERGDYLLAAYSLKMQDMTEEIANYYKLIELEQAYMHGKLSDKYYDRADSLCAYYQNSDSRNYAIALLVMSDICSTYNDYPTAVTCVLKARSIAEQIHSGRLLCLIYRSLGDLYFNQRMLEECKLPYSLYFKQAIANSDTLRMAYGAQCMAIVHSIDSNLDSIAFYYQLSIDLGKRLSQKDDIVPIALSNLCDLYIQTEQFQKAQELMLRDNPLFDWNWAYWYYGQNHVDSAVYYFQKLLGRNKWLGEVDCLKILAELEEQRGDTKASLEYYRLLNEAKDSLKAQQKQAETQQVEARYNYERIKTERDRLEQRNREQQRFIILLMVIVGIVSSAAWMAWHTLRQRRRANKVRWQLVEKEKELEQTRQQAEEPQRQREALLLELKGTAVYQRLKSPNPAVEKRVSEQEWQELATRLDDIYDHMSTRLHSLAKLSDTELRICYLLKLGVPPSDMAEILFKSKAAVTMARQRMYHKLTGRSARAEQFDQLLDELCP